MSKCASECCACQWKVAIEGVSIPTTGATAGADSSGVGLSPSSTMATAECIASANDLLAAHSALVNRVRLSQKTRRRQLRALPSPPQAALSVSLIPSPQPSPPASRSASPSLPPKPQPYRADLPPAKRARLARYDNYVPEEETIRNDYSQRYVDGGEWPQNWVLGADPDHRFEEYVFLLKWASEFIAKCRQPRPSIRLASEVSVVGVSSQFA